MILVAREVSPTHSWHSDYVYDGGAHPRRFKLFLERLHWTGKLVFCWQFNIWMSYCTLDQWSDGSECEKQKYVKYSKISHCLSTVNLRSFAPVPCAQKVVVLHQWSMFPKVPTKVIPEKIWCFWNIWHHCYFFHDSFGSSRILVACGPVLDGEKSQRANRTDSDNSTSVILRGVRTRDQRHTKHVFTRDF